MRELDHFKLRCSLPTIHYLPDYISDQEAASLLTDISTAKAKWNIVSGRRVQSHGGLVGKSGLISAPMPAWTARICDRVSADLGIYGDRGTANHVLINEYAAGQGIMPHEDGPAYFPAVAILSLGAPTVMNFHPKQGGGTLATTSVALLSRSLLVFRDDAYSQCLHGIESRVEDELDSRVCNLEECGLQAGQRLEREGTRVSLTIRRVAKVNPGVKIRL